jgi:hypothetical protein
MITDLKKLGYKQYKNNDFYGALKSYTAALECGEVQDGIDKAKLLSRIAHMHLKIGSPVAALKAAETAVTEDGTCWRGHQRVGDSLVKLFCFWEAARFYDRAAELAPSKRLKNAIIACQKKCAERLFDDPRPNMRVMELQFKNIHKPLPADTYLLSLKEAWEKTGLLELVSSEPQHNILHSTLLQAMRITHPGIALYSEGDEPIFTPRELGCFNSPHLVNMPTDLRELAAYTPLGYCFEVCCGFLAGLQTVDEHNKWEAYVVGCGITSHALLYSPVRKAVFDPLQLGKDPDMIKVRWDFCQTMFPWSCFKSPKSLMEWIGEYRSGEKLIPRKFHVAVPGGKPMLYEDCEICQSQMPFTPTAGVVVSE